MDLYCRAGLKRVLRVLAVVAVTVAVCACDPTPTSGTVISKDHTDSYFIIVNRVPIEMPETWSVCFRDDTEDRPVSRRDTGCVDVTQDEYQKYHVGDHYPS